MSNGLFDTTGLSSQEIAEKLDSMSKSEVQALTDQEISSISGSVVKYLKAKHVYTSGEGTGDGTGYVFEIKEKSCFLSYLDGKTKYLSADFISHMSFADLVTLSTKGVRAL